MKKSIILTVSIAAMSCSGAGFEGSSSSKKNSKDNGPESTVDSGLETDPSTDAIPGNSDDGFTEIDVDSGTANAVFDDKENGVRRESFGFGGDSSSLVVDYLFVMDNSCSMGEITTRTNAGFKSLAQKGKFPDNAKVAVMSTMPGDFADLNKPFVGNKYSGMNLEPGFLALVDRDRIDNFKNNVGPGKSAKWAMDGCEKAWFSPTEKNSTGQSCLEAHTQQTYHCVGAEAGLTSLKQLMQKRDGKKTFRDGAIVNVIFVSDTHDPGNGNGNLASSRPSFEDLVKSIKADNKVAGVKFHALAPESKCTGEDLHQRSYFGFVEKSKGRKADPCDTSDYTDFIEKMIEVSDESEDAVFVLSKEADKIVKVTVNGKETDDFEIGEDNNSIIMTDLDTDKEYEIIVTYKY